MKIANNKLSELNKYFHSELQNIYDSSEIVALFGFACYQVLKIEPRNLNLTLHEKINQSDLIVIYNACNQLKTGKPIQYVFNLAYFLDLELFVNNQVLIPRPETEELVLKIINEKNEAKKILDIGTGSGCIALALKKEFSDAKVTAIDKSFLALEILKINAAKSKLEIDAKEIDFLNADSQNLLTEFDLIVSNPPYILKKEIDTMEKNVKDHEPHLALFVEGDDEIIFYKNILLFCNRHLHHLGFLFLELNPDTSNLVYQFAVKLNYFLSVELFEDMSGKQRFLKAIKK